ncbi:MAG: response regulator [Dehalococcoidia bacterium]
MQPCRLLIADGDSDAAHAIESLLQFEADIEVIGVASTLEETIERAAETLPDVLLLDGQFARGGLERALTRLDAVAPATTVLLLLVHHGDAVEATEAGVGAWLMKDAGRDEILGAIRRHATG